MSTNERDTHFANAAKLFIERMKKLDGVYIEVFDFGDGHENLQAFVSQFFYDLVQHAISTPNLMRDRYVQYHGSMEKVMKSIPDMTELPAE